MTMHDGDTIFLTFAAFDKHHGPQVWVTRATVIDAANRVVREYPFVFEDVGRVRVLPDDAVESMHPCEADAWQAAAAQFSRGAAVLEAKAAECARKAAALGVGKAVPA